MSGAIRFDPLKPIVPGQSPGEIPLGPNPASTFKLPSAEAGGAPPAPVGSLVASKPVGPARSETGRSYGAGLSTMTPAELAQCEDDRRTAMA